MTSIHFALPARDISQRDFARFRQSFVDNFGPCTVHFTAVPDWCSRHAEAHQITVERAAPGDTNHVVAIRDRSLPKQDRDGLAKLPVKSGQRRWRFDLTKTYLRARLEAAEFEDYQDLFPGLDAHPFNRLGSRTTDQFIYFPYGYMFRMMGLGPLDEFSLRIRDPLDGLADRTENEKLILYFGGSAAWSLDCLYSEMLTNQLEAMLNDHAQQTGGGLSYRVVNMGQHGNVVLNEMLTYLLFGERLRPDIVIAHDGFNDMIYGVSNDSFLLGRHRIAYQDILEQWPMALYGSSPEDSTYHRESKFALRNTPEATVRAYLERKQQFERVVNATGAEFIWGVQPCLASKAAHHPLEDDYLDRDKPFTTQFGLAYANVERLLDDVGTALDRDAPSHVVDHHREFATASENDMCFADYVHCSPEGDARMAETYFQYFVAMGFAR